MKKLALFLALCLFVTSIGLAAFATDEGLNTAPVAPVEEEILDGETPAGETPAGETPAGETPAGETPAGETPAGETPAGETPAGETPAGETPAGETPAGETPAGETPAGETPAGETPAGETPAGETPAGETPAGETPAGETPAGETPAGETPAGETPAGQTPTQDDEAIKAAEDAAKKAEEDAAKKAEEEAKQKEEAAKKAAEEEAARIAAEEAQKAAEEAATPEEAAEEGEITEEEKNDDLNEAAEGDFIIRNKVIIRYTGTSDSITLPVYDKDGNKIADRLDEACFANNTSIKNLTMPADLDIDAGAFRNCTALLSVSMHNSITGISAECFKGCTSLASVSWPENLDWIDHSAFEGCVSLTGVPTNINMTWIGDNVFKGCTALTYADLPATLYHIGQGAFANCTGLKEIVLPNSVIELGNSAFENCSAAAKLVLSNGLTKINNYTFAGCTSVPVIDIPNGVTEIGREAFYGCNAAKIIRLPGSLKLVGMYAFLGRPDEGWLRWDACAGDAYIDTDALGVSGYILAPINSPAHVYCTTHSLCRFCSTLTRDFVERNYNLILNRASDEGGLLSWCGCVVRGEIAGGRLVQQFMNSAEFINRQLGNSEVMDILYRVMMNREADPEGKAAWLQVLNNGMTFHRVIWGFNESEEFKGICNAYRMPNGKVVLNNYRDQNVGVTAFVARCYTEALQRPFDPDGLEAWCQVILTKKGTPYQVAYGFIFSPEFVAKNFNNVDYVKRLYRTFFDRDADHAGLNAWVAVLNAGYSRLHVMNGFAQSAEFANLLASFGLK